MNQANPFSLRTLGLSQTGERIYRQLLGLPCANPQELANKLDLPADAITRTLDCLQRDGLVAQAPGEPPRYVAIAPDIAIQALVRKRQAEAKRALTLIPELQAATARRDNGGPQTFERLDSHPATQLVFRSMHGAASRELACLSRQPGRLADLAGLPGQSFRQDAATRGVRLRTLVDQDYLDAPDSKLRLAEISGAGSETRTAGELPTSMVIADARIALIPIYENDTFQHAFVIRSSPLVTALHSLFTLLWSSASPIYQEKPAAKACTSREELDSLVALMAAGLHDKHLCHQLGVSPSTIQRRISRLMQASGARTRFQLGWKIAHTRMGQSKKLPADCPNCRS